MKTFFKAFFFLTVLLFSIGSVDATTITWLGGNGAWEDSGEWDTGTVPSFGDDVIIPSGYVRIYNGDSQFARSIEVQASGRLYIYNGGALEVSGAVNNDGLHNMGRVYVYGDLAINSITQTSTAFSANAINNEGRIYTYSSCEINIKYIDDIAIDNAAAFSYFRHRGRLWIYDVEDVAIYNRDRFYNSGSVDVEESGESSGYLIVNSDHFRNYSSGTISLVSGIYGGISNNSSGANFRNYGEISIYNPDVGINNSGDFYNYADGDIDIENGSIGYYNRSAGTITNEGSSTVRHSFAGLYNFGKLINMGFFSVWYSDNNGAIRNFVGGEIDNYDDIYLSGDGYRDLDNDGEFNNHEGAIFEFNKVIDMSATGSLSNYGFIACHSSNNHIISGSIGNKGVIDDNHGTLQSHISNDRIVVAPVMGPMSEGVPFPNPIDLASSTGFTIGTWKVSQTGASAGTYNEATNEFTPNAAAIGISTIYIDIENIASGYSRNFSLEIDGGILPMPQNNAPGFSQSTTTDNVLITENDVAMFPNPTTGNVQLKSKLFEDNQTAIQVFNTLGQLVQQAQLGQGAYTQTINLSNQLNDGVYIIKMLQKGKEVNVQRIQLQR